jgi:hypothetical protein
MAELKTKPTKLSVSKFIDGIQDEQQRKDAKALVQLMKGITGSEAKMWGSSIVGFGDWHYKSGSGREGDWFEVGFSPRKQAMTLYLMSGFVWFPEMMKKLGKHKTGKGCLYIKKLDDVDPKVLKQLITESIKVTRKLAR